ncbi:MAG: isocitrate dehydrogenase kinase/phosphatase [marine bacterium B5-7]|nr:MAG: isocitrate dehydrogenase kinase/phosphatase [marine bacterium B5-7]
MKLDHSHSEIARAAQLVYDGFAHYNKQFKRITARARRRFEQRDWKGQIQDIGERVELYDKWVHKIHRELINSFHVGSNNRELWSEIRDFFGTRLENVPDAGFMKTFFNSISRRIFGTVGTDANLEFVQPPPDEGVESLAKRRYPCWENLEDVFLRVLKDFEFRIPFIDIEADITKMAASVRDYGRRWNLDTNSFQRFEFIDSHFFQGARAYLVGRILDGGQRYPMVVAFENTGEGIRVDAVLLEERQVSNVFSYTRSYYFTDPTSVVAAVHFLHTILPDKPIDELYTVLGRLRQGKTERFRVFSDHLNKTDDLFVHADGDRGLVMQVFTLKSFNLVFKVIRDQFGYPKNTTREEVMSKYRLVSNHDHAGRLIDTQEFRNLTLPVNRFEEKLLIELLEGTTESIHRNGDNLVLNHVYIERRVRPLNLYIREASESAGRAAILDYGQAIKDLAETNIFPGDLLLKNFGVTSSGRVVFYDYDEVALVTECRFRELPEPADDDFDLMDTGTTHYISPNDIFPEEFIKFLSLDAVQRAAFMEVHGDLLTAGYWREVKNRRLRGEITQVIPYTQSNIRQSAVAA